MTATTGLDWNRLARDHPFVREVLEQPAAFTDCAEHLAGPAGVASLRAFRDAWDGAKPARLVMSGMGSSLHACHLAAMPLVERGIPVSIIDTGELLYYILGSDVPVKQGEGKAIFLLVSQSGESAEIVKAIEAIKDKDPGAIVWGVTNAEQSTLAKAASCCGFLKAGTETSVTSKTFLNALLFMHALGRALAMDERDGIEPFLASLREEALIVAGHLRDLLATGKDTGARVRDFLGVDARFIEIIARGTSLATAHQIALNIRETNKIPSAASSGGQFRHGPIEMIDPSFRCIMLSSDDATRHLMVDMARNIARTWGGGKVAFVTNHHVAWLDDEPNVLQVVHGASNPNLAPVVETATLQLFMIALAVATGVAPGEFKHSSKVTRDG